MQFILIGATSKRLRNTDRARHWYERFTDDWKDADPDIPELIEARERLAELREAEEANAVNDDHKAAIIFSPPHWCESPSPRLAACGN